MQRKCIYLKLLIYLLCSFSFYFAEAQMPVKWNYFIKQIDEKTFEIHLTATIENGWHIYAQKQPPDAIAIPTKIEFYKNPLITLDGDVKEVGNLKKHNISEIGIIQHEYAGRVDFIQLAKLRAMVKTNIAGKISYQVCTDEQCLPLKEESFSLVL
jgi:hypothetical protein